MRILFIASRFPYPTIQGDRVRGYHQLRILSRQHHITLITPEPEGIREDNLQALRPFCGCIETVPLSPWRRPWRLGRALVSSLPLQTLYFFDPRFRQRVQSLLQEQSFDLVHVQLVRMAPAVDGLETIPKVVDLIDALSLNMARRAQRERGPLAWVAALEARRVQCYEKILTRQYDRLIVSSPLDRRAIGNYDNIDVIPNGVDIEAYPFNENAREPDMIVFTGRMSYFPNVDAATWFATEVFPLVRRRVAKAQFFIVGTEPTLSVQRLARQPGIVVTGYVPSIQDYLDRAAIAVAPMQAGSGMQFKVIEAMACGTPVVATLYALGGIETLDNEHLLVAQDAKAFAEQVVRLLKDSALQRRLARNARHLIEEKYTWDRSVGMLERVYRRAIDQYPKRQNETAATIFRA